MLSHPKDYGDLYEREYLYKEGSEEYWLVTLAPIMKYLEKELKPGDKMQLYLISIGAYRSKDEIDCVKSSESNQVVSNDKQGSDQKRETR